MHDEPPEPPVFPREDWKGRLDHVVATMRDLSRQQDPEAMVQMYGHRIGELMPRDRLVSLSRRGVERPEVIVARSSDWDEAPDPWHERSRLPRVASGILSEIAYAEEPRVIEDLSVERDDPGAEYLTDMRSMMAIPVFDDGQALNVVLLLSRRRAGFSREQLPEMVWTTNLFGRATHNLVLSEELRRTNAALDQELEAVAQVQRSLLPAAMPDIPTLDLAASYETSRHAGGDYYDVFPLPGDAWGMLMADVSGHGTSAAVMMAITHSLAHAYGGPPSPPGRLLSYLNEHLAASRYNQESGAFVTAWYGVFDPRNRGLTFASAGHPAPRLRRCGSGRIEPLIGPQGLPVGVLPKQDYHEGFTTLGPGDLLVLYTDGITEARNARGKFFGVRRLDAVFEDCQATAAETVQGILGAVRAFADGSAPEDDRTLLVARVR